MFNSDNEGIYYNATNGNLFFRINKSTIGTTESEINTYLQNNNIIVYYPLAEPITEPITNAELINQLNAFYNAKSYNGQTNISVEGDLPMILDVSAILGDE
jgi:hypothetical protein